MTTYTTTAIATSSVDNTVTVASISNMIPGLPITFSGVTFGGITQGSTYYIGTIIYGYPTSRITLTSLPGGAVFQLTSTATGSMTANWGSGGQQIIVTTPPGENLNTAFTKINTNFDQLWAAGPVNSNIKISDNTIYTLNTNGDLVLNPNGIGNIVANAHVVPDTTLIRNLGSPTRVWNEAYINYLSVNSLTPSEITIPVANLHILGGNANNFLQTNGDGNLTWALPIAAAGGGNTQIQYNNNGVLDASNTFTFTSNTSTVTMQNVTTTGVANLNSVSNIQIAGGVAGYVLQTDGTGNLSWTTPTGDITSILDQQVYGDGSTVNFTLITPSVTNAVIVSINGVMQIPSVAYTVATDIITFTEAPQTSDLVDIRFLVFGASPDNHPGGADGFIQFNSGGTFGGSGNLRYYAGTGNLYSSNVSVSGNITASNYFGDGSHLTGITAVANTGNITFANNVISTNNANAALNILTPQQTPVSMAAGGNSATAQMLWATNIGALTPADLNNGVINGNTWGSQISAGNTGVTIASNSVAGLKTWTFETSGTVSGTGGVIAGTISSTGNVIAAGNVSGNYILGNVAFATGISQLYGNSNVYALLDGSAADIIPLANVSYSLGNATNQWADLWVSNGTIYMNSVPITLGAGNVLSVAGNSVVTTTGGSTSLGNIGFNGNTIYDINGINLQNSDLSHGYTAGVLLPVNGDANAIVVNNTYGNIILQSGASSDPTATWTFRNNGNLSLPGGGLLGNTYGDNPNAAALQAGPGGYAGINSYDQGQFVQADGTGVYIGTDYTGNSCIWTFDASGNLTLPGNASSINYANGDPYGGTSGNPFNQNLNTGNSVTFASVSATGNVNSGNIHTGQISATGNIITANGNISGANYITGNFFVGDGSGLSNISVVANTGNVTFNNSTIVGPSFGVAPSANSSVYIQPTVDSATRYQFSDSTMSVPGAISATGNIFGGAFYATPGDNLFLRVSNGTMSLSDSTNQLSIPGGIDMRGNTTLRNASNQVRGTIDANIGAISLTGNVTSGNVLTGGLISATGNITGGNISTSVITLTNGAVIKDTASDAVAFGQGAGNSSQGGYAVAIGYSAGQTTQGLTAIAIGSGAGNSSQGFASIGIGYSAGYLQQGQYAVAIGSQAGYIYQANNSIILNATGAALDQTTANTFTVAPIRNDVANTGQVVFYNTSSKEITYGNTISVAGNVTAANFVGNGNTLSNVATQVTGTWTLSPGVNTVSFTVAPGYSYTMWVNGNIPNGIITWNATVTTSNTNVPVTGVQYGWYYAAGNALVLTSMPNQIVGTAGGISTATVATTTSNVFTFGITNNSGTAQVINWGYTRI